MLPSSSSATLPTVFFEAQDYLNLAFFEGLIEEISEDIPIIQYF